MSRFRALSRYGLQLSDLKHFYLTEGGVHCCINHCRRELLYHNFYNSTVIVTLAIRQCAAWKKLPDGIKTKINKTRETNTKKIYIYQVYAQGLLTSFLRPPLPAATMYRLHFALLCFVGPPKRTWVRVALLPYHSFQKVGCFRMRYGGSGGRKEPRAMRRYIN